MKLLIAVITCRKFTHRADVQRGTWVNDAISLGIDVRYFIGGDARVENDYEIVLPVPDDYPSVRLKVQHAMKWAVEHDYDHVLKTDDDCVVFPTNWLKSSFKNYEYVGRKRGPSGAYPPPMPGLKHGMDFYGINEKAFCSGFGYTVSNNAARVIANAPDNGDWAEDRFSGQALAAANVLPQPSPFYLLWPINCATHKGLNCRDCGMLTHEVIVVCPHDMPEVCEQLFWAWRTKGRLPQCAKEIESR